MKQGTLAVILWVTINNKLKGPEQNWAFMRWSLYVISSNFSFRLAHLLKLIWASTQEKPVFGVCKQQMCRPACAFVHSDQCLRYSLIWKILYISTCYKWIINFLARLCSWADLFEYDPSQNFLTTRPISYTKKIVYNYPPLGWKLCF